MDVRKVQKVSAGTYVISLPKKWAVRHNIKPGTHLAIDESASGHLVITPHASKLAPKTPQVREDDALAETIVACYIMGAMAIVVNETTPAMRAKTLSALQELPGFDVAEETGNTITIRCLLDESTVKFYGLLDRMCALLKYGVELTERSAVMQNEQEINKAYHLCERILTKASHDAVFLEAVGIPSTRVIPTLQLLVKRLEHVGDAMKDLPALDAKQQRWLVAAVDMVCSMVRLLTAGKLTGAQFPTREEITRLTQGQKIPQFLFLIRTLQDIKEELILLRVGMAMD
jgi:phosphate uptake regulator